MEVRHDPNFILFFQFYNIGLYSGIRQESGYL